LLPSGSGDRLYRSQPYRWKRTNWTFQDQPGLGPMELLLVGLLLYRMDIVSILSKNVRKSRNSRLKSRQESRDTPEGVYGNRSHYQLWEIRLIPKWLSRQFIFRRKNTAQPALCSQQLQISGQSMLFIQSSESFIPCN